MKKRVFILLALCWAGIASAQNINRFEYFFDTDPGVGASTTFTNIAPTTLVTDLNIPIATTSLAPGFHTLYIRSRNDLNQWTHTHFRNFFVATVPPAPGTLNIDRVEYFIDTDPGVGLATVATGLTPDDVLTNFPIDISAVPLTAGFHTFYVRAKTSDGQWTHTHFRNFFVDAAVASPPTITNFSPTSGNVGSSVTITGTNFSTTPANNTVTFNGVAATVTASTANSITVTVPPGTTTGPIRVVVSGLIAISGTNFSLSAPIISAAEYFFNTDPGPGNGIAIPLTPAGEIDLTNLNFITTSLPVGWHTVHVRARDTNNTWGFYESRRIYIREPAPTIDPEPPPSPITTMEFFYNNDNGPGTGTPITITQGLDVDVVNTNFSNTLPVGWHTVHVRTKNTLNIWGFYESRRIYVREPTPTIDPDDEPPSPITAMEFFYNTDNGPGTGTPVTITSGLDVDVVNTNFTNTLPVGWHTVHVRTKNALNTWGFYESRRIYIREMLPIPPDPVSPIVAFEYFVDNDPGVGLSTFNFTKPTFPLDLVDLVDEPLNVGVLSLGAHKIFIRAKNQNGDWGLSEVANFSVVAPCTVNTPPTATPGLRCDAGSVNLVAAGATVTQVYRWYTDATTLTILATTATGTYTTPPLSANTNFFVTIYDPATFCESARTQVAASISGIPKPALNINGSLSVCEGTTQVLSAPLGFTSYLWSNGLTTQTITANTSGSYTVAVSNAFCSSPPSDPFVFTVNSKPTKPTVNATGGGSLCGTGSVTLSAPAGLASYSWSSGQSTPDITVSTIGNFSVRTTNASGCQSDPSDVFTVTSGSIPKPVITPTGSTAICGSATVRLDAPAGFAGYVWSNGGTTSFINAIAGTYTVTVSDGTCSSPLSDAVVVTTSSVPATPSIFNTGVSALCTGTGLGSFTVLEAPSGFTNYLWSTNETTRQIVVNTGGTFTVQVGNSTNCLSAVSSPVVIALSGLPCNGGGSGLTPPAVTNGNNCGTGTVALSASGATGGQVYRWYSASTGGSILFTGASYTTPSIATTTIYYAAIFDATIPGESSRMPTTATITNYAPPVLAGPSTISICAGNSATLSAPTGFTKYLWSNGAVTQQIQPNTASSYSVQVGDPSCLSAASNVITINVVPVISKPVVTITGNTTLCGSSTVQLTAPAGFTYNWSTGETTQTITTGTAGNYTVAISNGTCTSPVSDAITVSSVAVLGKPTITVTGNTALCNGAFAVLSAPVSPFYLWSNGSTAQQITVTTAGNYSVQVGNAANCLSVASDPTVVTQTGLPCPGGTGPNPPTVVNGSRCGTGTVLLAANGATGAQEYRWYNVPTGGSSLSSNSNYTTTSLTSTTIFYVTIYDALVTPNESARMPVTATIVNIATPVVAGPATISICDGGSTLLSAPTGFVQYLWSNGAVTQQLSVSVAGNYSVQVGDGICLSPASNSISVSVSPTLSKPLVTVTGNTILCGSSTVQLSAPAGFTYNWSTSETTQTITTGTAGNYTVTISNGTCTSPVSDAITVSAVVVLPKPTITVTGNTALCNGAFTVLSAPVSPFYLWSNGATNQQITVTTAGNYSVQVGNAANCLSVASDATVITQTGSVCAPLINPPTIANSSRCGTGTVLLTASGGTGAQEYRWYDVLTGGTIVSTGATYTTPSIAATTIYFVSIFDSALPGESNRVPVVASVVNYAAPVLAGPATISICAGNSATLSAPTGFTKYLWSNGADTQQIQPTTGGTYSVQVGDATCLSPASNSITINVDPIIPKPTVTVTGNTILCGSSTAQLSAPAGFTYNWSTPSGNQTTQNITTSTAGNYTVTISNGTCTSPTSDIVNVTSVAELPKPTITVTGSTALCNGAFAVLSAPVSPFYLWSNGSTAQQITVTTAGSYSVQVGNAANCLSVASDATVVTQTGLPCPGGTGPNPPTVVNGSRCGTGTVLLAANGATGAQEYRWYNVPTGGSSLSSNSNYTTISLTSTTIFYVTIYDALVTPNESARMPVTATIVNIATPVVAGPATISICDGGSTLLSAPTGFVQYLWSNGAVTQQLSVSVAGNYSVQVGDGICLSPASNSIQIIVSPTLAKPVITASGSTTLCGGASIMLTAPAGFTYSWSSGETGQSITVTSSGNYSVTISNGICSATSDPTNISTSPIPAKPTITVASGNTTICGTGSIRLSAPTGYASYLWSDGETTREIFANVAASYSVVGRNAAGCESVASDPQTITVTPPPVVSFTTVLVTVGTPTVFVASASNIPTNPVFTWQFGDGNSTVVNALQNVSHTYAAPGLYFAQVTLGDGLGCDRSFTQNVTVNALAGPGSEVANFVTSPVCKGQTTTFTDLSFNLGAGATYAWDFENDGTVDNTTIGNVQHMYPQSGTYDAKLTITLQSGTVLTKQNQVIVNKIPTIDFVGDVVCANTPTTFTDTSTDVETSAIYSWDFDSNGTIDSSVKGNTTFTYTTAGSYTASLSINNNNGCSAQKLVNVQVGRVPFAQVIEIDGGGLPQLCAGSTLKLKVQAEAGSTYSWKKGVDVIGTNSNELLADAAGNYSVSISNTCGTVNAFNTITLVSVVPPVAQTISLTGSNSFCESESVLLTVPFVPGISYQWQKDNVDISGSTGTILFAGSSGEYKVITSNNCGSVASNVITLNQLPKRPSVQTIEIVGGQNVICAPNVVTLRVPQEAVVSSYQWRRNGILVSGATTNEVTVGQSGVYTVEIINTCSTVGSSNAAQITVNTKPIAQLINANRVPIICPGENVVLAVVPENGVNYQWTRDNNVIAGETQPQLTATQSGEYKLLLSNSCQSSLEAGNAIPVAVNQPPAPPLVTASGPTEICATEGAVVLSIEPITGVTYQWQRDNIALPFTNSNTFQATAAGFYSVKVNNSCTVVSSSNSVEVKLLPSPLNAQSILVEDGKSTEFCAPNSVKLLVLPQTGAIYQWRRNINTNVGTNSPTLEVTQSGTYDLVMTNGCRPVFSLNSIEVKVNNAPVLQSIGFNRSTALCEGEQVNLSVQLEPGVSFQWKKNGINLTGENASSLTVRETGDYNVILSNVCRPIETTTISVDVTKAPVETNIENLSATAFCDGGSVRLRVPFVSGQNYQWKRNGDNVGINTFEYLADESGIFTVELSNRCFTTAPTKAVTVTEFPAPAPPVPVWSQTNLCDPRTHEINTSGSFSSYWWYLIGTNTTSRIVNQNSAIYQPVVSGQYKVVGFDANGCTAESTPIAVTIEPVEKPRVIITDGKKSGLDSLLRSEKPYDQYQWYVNNKYIVGATQRELVVFYNGIYTLAIVDAKGCRAFSDPVVVNEESYKKYGRLSTDTPDGGIILPERQFDDEVELFPSPTQGKVEVFFYGSATEGTACTIYDQMGKEILSSTMKKENGYLKAAFDVSDQAQGIYLVRIRNKFVSITKKLMKE